MANQEHLAILKSGILASISEIRVWNEWRQAHPDVQPDLSSTTLTEIFQGPTVGGRHVPILNLSGANLTEAILQEANLSGVDLRGANLRSACLNFATFTRANLSRANLVYINSVYADFIAADLSGADLSNAQLIGANLMNTNLSHADLSNADLSLARLLGTNLNGANLTNCSVYGASVWDVHLEGAIQSNLIITRERPTITVDNLEVAQFIYLLLNNKKIRDVINTIGQKGVLILGRFSQERKPVLDALREKLRALNFLPIVFDFERPTERDFTETIMTLAGLSCFIIADITNPKSTPLELQAAVPNYMIPFVPILQEGEQPFSMFANLQSKYNWVLDTLVYDTPSHLIEGLKEAIVYPALEKRAELLPKKAEQVHMRDIRDYLKQDPATGKSG